MDFAVPRTVPDDVRRTVARYLRDADRALPGRITGFYLVGSVALGAYRPGRSDIDFVAVVDVADGDALSAAEVRRLRAAQVASGLRTGPRALAHGHWMLPGTLNGAFVRATDLGRPVTEIEPLASQVGMVFRTGEAFDVNPVQWTTLARHGVTVRGPEPASLGLDPQPEVLRQWNRRQPGVVLGAVGRARRSAVRGCAGGRCRAGRRRGVCWAPRACSTRSTPAT